MTHTNPQRPPLRPTAPMNPENPTPPPEPPPTLQRQSPHHLQSPPLMPHCLQSPPLSPRDPHNPQRSPLSPTSPPFPGSRAPRGPSQTPHSHHSTSPTTRAPRCLQSPPLPGAPRPLQRPHRLSRPPRSPLHPPGRLTEALPHRGAERVPQQKLHLGMTTNSGPAAPPPPPRPDWHPRTPTVACSATRGPPPCIRLGGGWTPRGVIGYRACPSLSSEGPAPAVVPPFTRPPVDGQQGHRYCHSPLGNGQTIL